MNSSLTTLVRPQGVINLVRTINEIKEHHPAVSCADTFQLGSALSIEVCRFGLHLYACPMLILTVSMRLEALEFLSDLAE